MTIDSLTKEPIKDRRVEYKSINTLIDRALELVMLVRYGKINPLVYPWWDKIVPWGVYGKCPACKKKVIPQNLFDRETAFTGTECLSVYSSFNDARSVKKRYWEVGYENWFLLYYQCPCGYEYARWGLFTV